MFTKFETIRNSLLVLFTDYCRVLHTFCRKFNLFIVNNFDFVLQFTVNWKAMFLLILFGKTDLLHSF